AKMRATIVAAMAVAIHAVRRSGKSTRESLIGPCCCVHRSCSRIGAVDGCWSLVAGRWLNGGSWLLVAGCWSAATSNQLPATSDQLPYHHHVPDLFPGIQPDVVA